jgi:hypothetical protein
MREIDVTDLAVRYTQGGLSSSSTTSGTTPTETTGSINLPAKNPALIGGLSALGVVVAVCLLGVLIVFVRKRRRTLQQGKEESRGENSYDSVLKNQQSWICVYRLLNSANGGTVYPHSWIFINK